MRWLYTLVLVLALPAILIRLLWRSLRGGGYLAHLGERFGRYAAQPAAAPVWIHAVSVGEARAAHPLVDALLERDPECAIVMTYMTPTGRATGESLFGDRVAHAYLPYDYPWAARNFLAHFAPRLGLVMETEVWPNLIAACNARSVPACLINARLSEKSARGYGRLGGLAREAFAGLDLVAAQAGADAERITRLGARNVHVCGNIKFDVTLPADLLAMGQQWREEIALNRRVVLAASTREGEEKIVLKSWAALSAEVRNATLLVLVPRHPQRFEEVAGLVASAELTCGNRSNAAAWNEPRDVWLGDSMGEMPAYFAMCDAAVMGGSLLDYGSQNLIEPCAAGKPVILGPSTFNFAEAAKHALATGAALQCTEPERVVEKAIALCADEYELRDRGQKALAFAHEHRGATARTMALLSPWLGRGKRA